MAGAWIFFATFIALFITATAQDDTEKCIRKTCGHPGEACNREKCDNHDGYCIRQEDCNNITICPGGCNKRGRAKWCKFHSKCKCCLPDVCKPPCNTTNGMCMNRKCKCDPGWEGPTCDEFYCDPACNNETGRCTGANECTCDPYWKGPTCDEYFCDPECVNGNCAGPNECSCDPGWCGPACNESCCDPDCQNGGTCIGINDCVCPADSKGPICECQNAKKCNNVNGVCYPKGDPILQNSTACPNTFTGRYCNSKDCTCCWE